MLLNEICSTAVVCCSRETSALEAATIMRKKHVGDLVVVDGQDEDCTPVGLITDRDLVVKVLGNELDPASTPVGRIMRTPLVTAQDIEDTSEAIARMRANGVRRLPVLGREGTLVGIVTLDDLLKLVATEATALTEIVTREQDREQRALR
jgi:CBS domain-containing protein